MLSARLVQIIEDHADELTRGAIHDLQTNPRTPTYHRLPREELHNRVYEVYRNLGNWLGREADEAIETKYQELGKKRAEEGVPPSEVVYALILTKYHLRDYIRSAGLVDSAVELYQQGELLRLVSQFFDRAIYYTMRGYERAGPLQPTAEVGRAGARRGSSERGP
jgi:hypothetical protein